MPVSIQKSEIYGGSAEHVVEVTKNIYLHQTVKREWSILVHAAKNAGFDLAIASGFRSMSRQRLIWERKLCGDSPLLDKDSQPISVEALSSEEKIEAILHWSALPGASRHHWGTDLDIYDKAAIPENYSLQLVPEEYLDGGPFAPMLEWMYDYLSQGGSPDFFFPYWQEGAEKQGGGVGFEPWHISHRPVASRYAECWSKSGCLSALSDWSLTERELLEHNFNSIYDRFIAPYLLI